MWGRIELSQHVKVGRRPPGEREIDTLGKEGVRAIIDLRTRDETSGRPMPPAVEATHVRARGMDYIHVPVSSESVDKTDLDRVGEALRQAPKPLLIHDSGGNRAGMIALAHTAIEAGVPGLEMIEMARHLDLVFGDPAQQEVFAQYVDQRRTRPDPFMRRKESVREEGHPLPLLGEDTRTLAGGIQEDHHREFAQDEAQSMTPAPTPLEERPIDTEPLKLPIAAPKPRQAVTRASAARPLVTPKPKLAPTPQSASGRAWTPSASRLASRIKVIPATELPRHPRAVAWSPPTPAALGMGAAIATAILLAIDRRLLVPLLIAAGVIGARVIARFPPSSLSERLLAAPAPDQDVDDLEKRVQRLAKRA